MISISLVAWGGRIRWLGERSKRLPYTLVWTFGAGLGAPTRTPILKGRRHASCFTESSFVASVCARICGRECARAAEFEGARRIRVCRGYCRCVGELAFVGRVVGSLGLSERMSVRHHGVGVMLYHALGLRRIASWRQHLCRTHVVEGRLAGRADWLECKVFGRDLQTQRRRRDGLNV